MVLTKDDGNVFKCGLSVAPVTDWIYYGESIVYAAAGVVDGTRGQTDHF